MEKYNKSEIIWESVVTDGKLESRIVWCNNGDIHLSVGEIDIESAKE